MPDVAWMTEFERRFYMLLLDAGRDDDALLWREYLQGRNDTRKAKQAEGAGDAE